MCYKDIYGICKKKGEQVGGIGKIIYQSDEREVVFHKGCSPQVEVGTICHLCSNYHQVSVVIAV